ncbi:MAG TPA: hypothetical protein VKP30_12080 [Polyangiaceae bacterium]|nr:hypothetical protein [Polyangiaceae bacterium]
MMQTTPSSIRQLHANDRGAILVFGLLACILLVGVLWTMIGVGDITAFRERAQDAADSGAYSSAVMMARGMNTIVLFNLLMSFVLAVRIVLKLMQLGVLIAAAACFASIIFIPVGATLLGVVGTIQSAITATREPINMALEGLNLAANSVQTTIPAFAKGTGNYIAKQYAPTVKSMTVASPYAEAPNITVSIPGEKGQLREDPLGDLPCKKAGQAVVKLFNWFLSQLVPGLPDNALNFLSGPLGELTGNKVTALYFCELGVNVPPPDTPDLDKAMEQISKDCMKQLGWEDRDVSKDPLSTDEELKLSLCTKPLTEGVDAAKEAAVGAISEAANDAVGLASPPTLNLENWQNGDPSSHVIAVAVLEPTKALHAARGVNAGGFGETVATKPDATAVDVAFAESEIYYDCIGNWDSDCNGKEEAMWNFAWRARLVSVDPEGALVKQYIESATKAIQSELQKTGSNAGPVKNLLGAKTLLVH